MSARLDAPLCLILSLVVLSGCMEAGKTRDIKLEPVTGTVKLDGQPLAGANVQFLANGGMGYSYGATDASGKYVLKAADGREGVEAGAYKVTVTKFAKPDGSPLPNDLPPDESAAQGVEHMPAKYADPEQTELTADVPAGGKTFDFDLSK